MLAKSFRNSRGEWLENEGGLLHVTVPPDITILGIQWRLPISKTSYI
jgi:hypothetical protein